METRITFQPGPRGEGGPRPLSLSSFLLWWNREPPWTMRTRAKPGPHATPTEPVLCNKSSCCNKDPVQPKKKGERDRERESRAKPKDSRTQRCGQKLFSLELPDPNAGKGDSTYSSDTEPLQRERLAWGSVRQEVQGTEGETRCWCHYFWPLR